MLGPHALSVRLFYRHSETSYSTSIMPVVRTLAIDLHSVRDCHEQLFAGLSNPPPTTFVPVRHISNRDDDDWDFAMFIVGS